MRDGRLRERGRKRSYREDATRTGPPLAGDAPCVLTRKKIFLVYYINRPEGWRTTCAPPPNAKKKPAPQLGNLRVPLILNPLRPRCSRPPDGTLAPGLRDVALPVDCATLLGLGPRRLGEGALALDRAVARGLGLSVQSDEEHDGERDNEEVENEGEDVVPAHATLKGHRLGGRHQLRRRHARRREPNLGQLHGTRHLLARLSLDDRAHRHRRAHRLGRAAGRRRRARRTGQENGGGSHSHHLDSSRTPKAYLCMHPSPWGRGGGSVRRSPPTQQRLFFIFPNDSA